jgi:cobalamin biosynthesis protein CobD/CbiB
MTRGPLSTILAVMTDVRNGSETPAQHPIKAIEHEVDHLDGIADKGESPATPAILIGKEIFFLVAIVVLVVALSVGIAYLATR